MRTLGRANPLAGKGGGGAAAGTSRGASTMARSRLAFDQRSLPFDSAFSADKLYLTPASGLMTAHDARNRRKGRSWANRRIRPASGIALRQYCVTQVPVAVRNILLLTHLPARANLPASMGFPSRPRPPFTPSDTSKDGQPTTDCHGRRACRVDLLRASLGDRARGGARPRFAALPDRGPRHGPRRLGGNVGGPIRAAVVSGVGLADARRTFEVGRHRRERLGRQLAMDGCGAADLGDRAAISIAAHIAWPARRSGRVLAVCFRQRSRPARRRWAER